MRIDRPATWRTPAEALDSQESDRRDAGLSKRQVDDLRRQFEELPPSLQPYAEQILEEYVATGFSPTLEYLSSIDYVETPVPIEQFIEDEFYFGRNCAELFPQWRHDLCEVFKKGSKVVEWILGGAIGTGKTTAAIVGYAYTLYCNLCLRNPHKFYSLMGGNKIVFGIYSVTKVQVKDVGYEKLRGMLERSPFWQKRAVINDRITTRTEFKGKDIRVVMGSKEFHALGQDMLSFLMDEANFMQQAQGRAVDLATEMDEAYKIYNAARTRMKSRFMQTGGAVPGMVFMISSKRQQSSFLEHHIANSKRGIEEGTVYHSEYSQWEVKPKKLFTMPTFKVEVGDRIYPSRVLDATDVARQGAQVIDVPGEYFDDFDRDVNQALRDIAGVATYGMSPLFRNKEPIIDCITEDWEHPFTRQELTISVTDDEHTLDSYFLREQVFAIRHSVWVPRRHPGAPRTCHIDIGLSEDAAGIAIGHVAGYRDVKRQRADRTAYTESVPIIEIDFMLRIVPPKNEEISLPQIYSFLVSLREMGLPIMKVTCDGYQSVMLLQLLKKIGFEDTMILSIDRTDEPYLQLRGAVNEGRVRYYAYKPFLLELSDLERDVDKRKVDHPKRNAEGGKGSKDVSDAVAGVVTACMTDPLVKYDPTVIGRIGPDDVVSKANVVTDVLGHEYSMEKAKERVRKPRRRKR